MDASRIVRRIYDNLSWPASIDAPGRSSSAQIWDRVKALLDEPGPMFVAALYPLLLGRFCAEEEQAALSAHLASGVARSVVVRQVALSDEARAGGLDISWLPLLAAMERELLWPRLRNLWPAGDGEFVEGLYLLLLGRRSDAGGAAGYRAQLAKGAPRSEVVRCVALSDEARAAGLDVSWLPRLRKLERGRRRLRFGSLRSLLRRWVRRIPMPSEPEA